MWFSFILVFVLYLRVTLDYIVSFSNNSLVKFQNLVIHINCM